MTAPTFLSALGSGDLARGLFTPFPRQGPADQAAGDVVASELEKFLRARLDPDRVDLTGELPSRFADDLRGSGYLGLCMPAELGGLALSPYNAFSAIEHAAALCMPAGQMLAIQAGVGAPALYPALPPGPLREHVGERLAAGAISGFGFTEPAGQNNVWPGTTATRSADGLTYVLRGRKVFTGHGPLADLLAVAATEHTEKGRRLCVCFVDTSAAGFEVTSHVEFTGSRGLPNGALSLDGVEVPAAHVVRGEPEEPRFPDLMASALLTGQLYFTAAPAMAIAKLCRRWSGEFVARRTVDGRALGSYEEIRRQLADTLAEVYAMEAVIRWSLIGSGPTDRWFERLAAKNLLVRACWRIVDRTVSLYGAEGVETLPSKVRRGAPPVPVERRLRDARGLRIAGNVDFMLDAQAGRRLLTGFYAEAGRSAGAAAATGGAAGPGPDADVLPGLSPALRAALEQVGEQVERFYGCCRELVDRHPDPATLFRRERTLILLGRIAAELFAVSAVLSRAGHEAAAGAPGDGGRLAEIYAAGAGHRLADYWRRLSAGTEGAEPDYAGVSTRWLATLGADGTPEG
ncbi:acyl-CoA dehydrogenase family protein [Streptomyces sp. HPF1205]|uniref:acyl-CoA dehydrogenase family protein n=1 Tax=Streptomyces sp. HPF1205 TaxID=2873262 RepID=UPI001CEC46E5|nr:acyl-CoA dehydrogenase family protein [Streptomyces sp. HPF1205]